jgi:hypothetical protein
MTIKRDTQHNDIILLQNIVMLGVVMKPYMTNVVKLNVAMLSVFIECRCAKAIPNLR